MKLSYLLLAASGIANAAPADWQQAGATLLDGVNQARASGYTCGGQPYPPAPPLNWSPQLGEAALEHSTDMAARGKMEHNGSDGGTVVERTRRAGYYWQRLGENIAYGQWTPQEVLATWLASPPHCANIMNRDFTEMGAAFSARPDARSGLLYWTQVFGKPR